MPALAWGIKVELLDRGRDGSSQGQG